jgi:hypothetical protein
MYEYGTVPPFTNANALPLRAPIQVILVEVSSNSNSRGSSISMLSVIEEQASVRVTV